MIINALNIAEVLRIVTKLRYVLRMYSFLSSFFLTKLAYAQFKQQLALSIRAHLQEHKASLYYKSTIAVYSLSWRIYFHINGIKLRGCLALTK